MKKIIMSLLIGCMIFSFISCGNEQTDVTTTETTNTTNTTTTTETTVTTTETSETTTETTTAESTTVHIWNYPDPIEPEKWEGTNDEHFRTEQGENEFESFYTVYKDVSIVEDRTRPPVLTAREYMDGGCTEPIILVFRVLASENKPDYLVPETHYYVQIVDAYGNITYDPSKTLRIAFQGSDIKQRYGNPTL